MYDNVGFEGFGDVEGIIYQGVGAIQSEEPEHCPSGLYMVGRCHHFIMIIFAMVMEAMSNQSVWLSRSAHCGHYRK
jgi:hypothetical protein